jgi:hypothetical protein
MRDFDTVWHAALINKLKPIGIKGSLLLIIDQCYTDMKSAVFLNGANIVLSSSKTDNMASYRIKIVVIQYKDSVNPYCCCLVI